MKHLLLKLSGLKADLKSINITLKEELQKNSEYCEFFEDLKASKEVCNAYKKKMIEESADLQKIVGEKEKKNLEIKSIKKAINDSIVITDKESGEVVQLTLF